MKRKADRTKRTKSAYQKAGVDPDKAAGLLKKFSDELGERQRDPRLLAGIGPFAASVSLVRDVAKLARPTLVACCDGVGTKLKLALQWKMLGGLGFDLVAMNVNDLLCSGAMPFIFLDYYACGKLEAEAFREILSSIRRACEEASCLLVGGETAEMPGLYRDKDFDLAGFAVGLANEADLLGPRKVANGDWIVGLPSSGFHSTGFSLIRRVIEKKKIRPNSVPSFDTRTWREMLLAPTRIYTRYLGSRLGELHSLAHLTGGGLYENLPRALPDTLRAVLKRSAWTIPPLFDWFGSAAAMSEEELFSTFNVGYGMLVMAPPDAAKSLLRDPILGAVHLGVVGPRRADEGAVGWENS